MNEVVTIVLAGGQGTRLFPLTKIRSKPAVPIAGRFRLIDISLSNCLHSGLRKIFILTQFATESLHRHIFLTYRFDEFSRGFLTILSAQQTLENRDWYQGTADAVRQNLAFFRDKGDPVLILSGDHLYRMDYERFIDFHVRKKAEISLAATPVSAAEAREFGVMKASSNGRVSSFLEKPKTAADLDRLRVPAEVFRHLGRRVAGKTHLASMGVYLFSGQALKELLDGTEFKDFGREVIPQAIRKHRVFAYLFDGYWRDIGTIRSFYEANIDLTLPLPRFNFYDEERPIFTHAGTSRLQDPVLGGRPFHPLRRKHHQPFPDQPLDHRDQVPDRRGQRHRPHGRHGRRLFRVEGGGPAPPGRRAPSGRHRPGVPDSRGHH
jgi:glucose-1-phosphate adenylyltransferase